MKISFIKNLIPLNLFFWLKYRNEFKNSKSINSSSSKRIYYLDSPEYGNLGDQAIALAIREFAKKQFPSYEFIEILQKDLPCYIESLKKSIRNDDLIFLTGGGNMGNLYRTYEAARRFVIKKFPNIHIVVFPQSICYTSNWFGRKSFNTAQKIYNKKNILTCARERKSFVEMKKLNDRSILIPDIVLSLHLTDEVCSNFVRKGVGLCLRNDIERLITDEDAKTIKEVLKKQCTCVTPITTTPNFRLNQIDETNREMILMDKFAEFGSKELIVTDRLHAMIFSVLTQTPCIVFDNNNKKISETYRWLKNNPSIKLINNVKELPQAIDEVIGVRISFSIDDCYEPLINAIKQWKL